jgi:phytoene dehydrogenase-like protein
MREGHALRDGAAPAPPSGEMRCAVAMLGSGVAGLTAAWRLAREGQRDVVLVNGPEPDGNAAGGTMGGIACPRGAHYLPLPGIDAMHVREILADVGILLGDPHVPASRNTTNTHWFIPRPNARWPAASGMKACCPRRQRKNNGAVQAFNVAMQAFARHTGDDGRPGFTCRWPLARRMARYAPSTGCTSPTGSMHRITVTPPCAATSTTPCATITAHRLHTSPPGPAFTIFPAEGEKRAMPKRAPC